MHAWFYHYPKAFTQDECEAMVDYAPQYPEITGSVGHGGGATVHPMRASTIRWMPRHDSNIRFAFDRIALSMLEANHKYLHQEVDAYPWLSFQNAQFTTYHGTPDSSGHYDWHEDNCFTPAVWTPTDRKLSCVLLLSDPAAFEGGALEVERAKLPSLNRGDLVVFPSHARHRVTPVTSGTRHSLVVWASGPRLC